MDPVILNSPTRSAAPEKQFGNYTILEHLGTGGMGDVYKAIHVGLDRLVALKILPPMLARNQEYSDRFLAEAYAISRLQHQNIVTIYDYGEENGQKFIAMQFIQGVTLSKLIRSEFPLDYARIINIVKQICRGLKYAHAGEVVHRDIKSGNIMISPGDKAYISDFGIAKVVDTPSITTTGMALGTPEYMAPEQCEGGTVDAQSDLYALGTILHEMVTGQPPFRAETPLAVAFKQVHELPPLLSKVRPDVPPRLELIAAKCLKKRKEERYRNADELLQDLDSVYLETKTASQPIAATSPNLRITDRRQGDRRYLLALSRATRPRSLLLVALVLLLGMAGFMAWQFFSRNPLAQNAGWIRPLGQGSIDLLWDGNRNTTWSPTEENGELVLDLGTPHVLQALYLETGRASGLLTESGHPTGVEISLDGKKPLRYGLEETTAPQTLQLQGRLAQKVTLRFATRGGTPAIREARLLGFKYE